MLPSQERLRKPGLFQRAYSARKSVSDEALVLYVLERQPRSAPRAPLVGVVVSKKVYARAVDRNRAKRLVREAYRLVRRGESTAELTEELNLKQWYAIVWVINGDILAKSWQDVRQMVERCLVKAQQRFGNKRVSKSS